MQTSMVLTPGGQPTGVVPMQNVVIMPNYVLTPVRVVYASKTSFVFGVIQIATGILCIAINVAAITEYYPVMSLGHGIWTGLFFILTGAFGILAAKKKTTCSIVTFMMLSILAATVFVLPLFILASIDSTADWPHIRGQDHSVVLAMNSVLLILAMLEAFIATCSALLGCRVTCCEQCSQSGMMMQQVPVMMSATQVVYTASFPDNSFQNTHMRQQGYPSPTAQPQRPVDVFPPQYVDASAPPPYASVVPSASGEPSPSTPLVPGDEKDMFR